MPDLMHDAIRTKHLNMDRRWLMLALFVGVLLIYLSGEISSPYLYSDPAFVIHYFRTEVMVVAYMLLVTVIFLPAGRTGLRRPGLTHPLFLVPFILWLAVALGTWAWARASQTDTAIAHDSTSWLILRTTLLVGVTEEWIFRGCVFAVLARWLGLRRGAYAALAAFGVFHLMNIVAGSPVGSAMMQMVMAFMSGSILLLAAVCTRSLWLPMIGHGLYDFAVLDLVRMSQLTSNAPPYVLIIMANGILLSIICLVLVMRLPEGEPFA